MAQIAMSDDFFAPPPFRPEEALARARRDLRELGLTEREGVFERKGQAIARLRVEGDVLIAARVKRPARTPEWQETRVRNSAEWRDFATRTKQALTQWTSADE